MALYTPAFEDGISEMVEHVVAISPATHGTDFGGLYKLAQRLGIRGEVGKALQTFGYPACDDYGPGGFGTLQFANAKSISQPGNKVTVMATKYDEIVTPYTTAFVDEPGVRNLLLQDTCPLDTSAHIGEALSPNAWNLVLNTLEETPDRKHFCVGVGGGPF